MAKAAALRKPKKKVNPLEKEGIAYIDYKDVALLLGGNSRHPARADLAAVRDELAQQRDVLVVDVGDALLVERVHLLLRFAQGRSLRHFSNSSAESTRDAG